MSQAARTEVTTRPAAEVVTLDAGNLMDALIRAASDPSTDVDKLERLGALYERIAAQQAKAAFNDAMNATQGDLRSVATDAHNPQTHSKYASYPALDRAVRPVYAKHGFSLSFDTADGAPPEHVRVVCTVAHVAGHDRTYHVDMPADGKGAKGGDVMTKTHAAGAAMSYGQRYLLKLIFNIAVGDDLDGNAPKGPREMGEAAKRALSDINACTSASDLALWKKNQSAGVSNVVAPGEMKEIISTFNRRVEAMKGATHGA